MFTIRDGEDNISLMIHDDIYSTFDSYEEAEAILYYWMELNQCTSRERYSIEENYYE